MKHAAKALQIAMKRDSATGDSIKLVAITKKGFKEILERGGGEAAEVTVQWPVFIFVFSGSSTVYDFFE